MKSINETFNNAMDKVVDEVLQQVPENSEAREKVGLDLQSELHSVQQIQNTLSDEL